MFNRIMEYDGRGEYVKLIHDDPTLFEMGLFSYMSQLEEVDERARVFIYINIKAMLQLLLIEL